MTRLLLITTISVLTLFASTSSAEKPTDTMLGVWVVDYQAVQDADWFRKYQEEESFPAKGVPFWAMHVVEIRPDSVVFSQDIYGFGYGSRERCTYEQIGARSVRFFYEEIISWRVPMFEITVIDSNNLISHIQHEDWELDLPLKRVFRASPVGLGAELPKRVIESIEGVWVVDEEQWGQLNHIDDDFFSGIASSFEPKRTHVLEFDQSGSIVCEWVEGERIPMRMRDFDGEHYLLAAERITLEDADGSIFNVNTDDMLIVLTIEDQDHITLRTSAYRTPMIRVGTNEEPE